MNRRIISLLSGPLFFLLLCCLPRPSFFSEEGWRVLAVSAWMISWWIGEAVAPAVTALLPMVLFPLLGIAQIQQVCESFGNPTIFLFMGGFVIALAMEKWNLHRRLALNMIRITGTDANGIILGFMLATALLSMWISNTATTIMMLAIVQPTVRILFENSVVEEAEKRKFALCLMLGIAYSASIGGIATIIGTPPNMVMVGITERMTGRPIPFFDWMLACTPLMFILLFFCYFLLTRILFPFRIKHFEHSSALVAEQIKGLGPMQAEEKMVSIIFALTALLWIFSHPLKTHAGLKFLDDTSVALFGALLLFIAPVKGKSLLKWEDCKELQWGILLLFGGGMAMAKGLEQTGVIGLLAQLGSRMEGSNVYLVVIVFSAISIAITEIMSNVALATIMVPLVIGVANGMGENPILFALPVALSSSFAFMMPISTPPNAIVYATGYIRMKEMIRAGFWLNVFGLAILSIFIVSVFSRVF